MSGEQENPAVTRFREYLRINTMQPNPDYDAALVYIKKQADDMGLEFRRLESGLENRQLGLVTWKGSKPDMKAILLTGHMDVVPVFPDKWTYEPFSAHKDEKGDIYARGSQDMKCCSCWYLEAIRRFQAEGKTFARTIHVLFTPDEEIGSAPTELFVKSQEFKDLNLIFGLDEGLANPGQQMRVFYGERSVWWIKVICGGNPGHGSMFIEGTAGKKLQFIINKFMGMRDENEKKFNANPADGLGAVTTINLTMLEGGVQPNVVPANLSATFDMRVPPTEDFKALKSKLQGWCTEAGGDVELDFLQYGEQPYTVKCTSDNPWWQAFSSACKAVDVELQPEIFPAGTDSRFFRQSGVDMLGFSPMNNTPILLHDHNEFLSESVFLRGIDVYCSIIPALADLIV